MLVWLSLHAGVQFPPTLPYLVTAFLLHLQSPFQPGWKTVKLEVHQQTEFTWAGARQGRLGGKQDREAGAVASWGLDKVSRAQWWILFQEDLKGDLSSWRFPAAPSSRVSIQPLQKTIALLFLIQCPRNTAKMLHSQRQILLLSPGSFGHQEACIHLY